LLLTGEKVTGKGRRREPHGTHTLLAALTHWNPVTPLGAGGGARAKEIEQREKKNTLVQR